MLSQIKHSIDRVIYPKLPESYLYRQGKKPNLLLYSSRRGGSTFLADLISSDPGIRSIDQPFDTFDRSSARVQAKLKYIPEVMASQYIHLPPSEAEAVQKYMSLLMSGGIRELSDAYYLPKSRTILKILNAIPLLDWFAGLFNVYSIYLARHPIPQAMSVIRNNWQLTTPAYLHNEYFVENYLTSAQREEGFRILENGTPLQKGVLNWIMENYFPLKFAQRITIKLTYEDLTMHPEKYVHLLQQGLELDDGKKMMSLVNVPSRSNSLSNDETNKAIVDNNKEYLVGKWQNSVPAVDKENVQKVLDVFNIYEYSADSALPHEKFLQATGVIQKPPAELQ
jgi:hypothetical protein